MQVREPAVAGQFYPAARDACLAAIEECRRRFHGSPFPPIDTLLGGLVPHAGWNFSGPLAAGTIDALTRERASGNALPENGRTASHGPETFVVFGAVHRRTGPYGSVFARGAWRTPLGVIAIDEELASAVVAASPDLRDDPHVHGPEHSIEVEVPFIQVNAPQARLLPIMIPPLRHANELGHIVAREAHRLNRRVMFLASTDLTHYGPHYGYTPVGLGNDALRWAKEINDRRMLDLVTSLQDEAIVPEAREHLNACGAGAVAATLAACKSAGARRGVLLMHVNSSDMAPERGEAENAVGYAGAVFTSAAG